MRSAFDSSFQAIGDWRALPENIPPFFVPTEQIPAAQRLDAGIFGDLSDGVEILEESSGFPQNPSDPRLALRQSLAG